MRDYFARTFRYDAWANRAALAACEQAGEKLPATALKRLAHVAAAHRLWQARLEGEAAPVPVWPEWSPEETARQIERAADGWAAWLGTCTPERLNETISYANSKGDVHESRVEDVLTHVLLHAAYHRGQIASDLRAAGVEPAATDFIHATRAGLIA